MRPVVTSKAPELPLLSLFNDKLSIKISSFSCYCNNELHLTNDGNKRSSLQHKLPSECTPYEVHSISQPSSINLRFPSSPDATFRYIQIDDQVRGQRRLPTSPHRSRRDQESVSPSCQNSFSVRLAKRSRTFFNKHESTLLADAQIVAKSAFTCHGSNSEEGCICSTRRARLPRRYHIALMSDGRFAV